MLKWCLRLRGASRTRCTSNYERISNRKCQGRSASCKVFDQNSYPYLKPHSIVKQKLPFLGIRFVVQNQVVILQLAGYAEKLKSTDSFCFAFWNIEVVLLFVSQWAANPMSKLLLLLYFTIGITFSLACRPDVCKCK